jgi:hypothetical protein
MYTGVRKQNERTLSSPGEAAQEGPHIGALLEQREKGGKRQLFDEAQEDDGKAATKKRAKLPQQREDRPAVMTIIRQIEGMEYREQAAKAGGGSSGLEGRVGLEGMVGHASGKVGDKRRFGDACDTGWGEAAEEGPHGEGGGEGGEKLKDERQKETKHKREEFQDKGKGEAVEKRKRPLSEGAGTARKTQDADDRTWGSAIAGVC